MKVAICDDDNQERELTETLAHKYFDQISEKSADIFLFSSGQELLEEIRTNGPFSIYLLDILMPGLDGIELGEQIRSMDSEGLLIYLTYSDDYYPDAFRVYAFQYLLKPLGESALFPVLDRALERIRQEEELGVITKTPEGAVFIPFSKLVYIEQLNRRIHYHMIGGKELISVYTRVPFEESISPFLAEPRFVRPHQAFLVNLDRVHRVETKDFVMEGDVRIPLSRSYAKTARSHYMKYLMDSVKQD